MNAHLQTADIGVKTYGSGWELALEPSIPLQRRAPQQLLEAMHRAAGFRSSCRRWL